MGYPTGLDEHDERKLTFELNLRATRRSYGRCDYCDRLRDEGEPCKFPKRHRLAMTIAEAKATGG